ncbi:Nucleobase-ascorbate transporter 7 [Bienertia sinuspersici]
MAGGGGGHGPQPKQDELQPHPVKDQLPGVSYCITSPPPWPEAILLGFQHYLVMLGTTVLIPTYLVPQMGGGNEEKAKMIQTLLFVAGLNTLFQSTFGTRLPAVIGGSYTYVPTTISIVLAGRYSGIADPQEKFNRTIRGIQGSLIVASVLQIVLGFSGLWRNVARFLSPLAAVPLVALTGFGLYELGFPGYIPHVMRGERHIFDRFAVLFSVVIVWIYAHILTVGGAYKNRSLATQLSCRTDRAGIIGGASWISIPYPFQWGAPTFDAGEAFAMMMASFVALVESTGAFIAVSRYASKFGAVFASIPAPMVAALYCLFSRPRFPSVLQLKQLQNEIRSGFNDMINVPFSSEPFVAGLLAFFLDVTLHKTDSATRKDRGALWWDRFRTFKSDTRSEEFYSLPFNLNKFFPSV